VSRQGTYGGTGVMEHGQDEKEKDDDEEEKEKDVVRIVII
jgi:hypothetical protein